MFKVAHIQYKTTMASAGNRIHQAFLEAGLDSTLYALFSEIDGLSHTMGAGKRSRLASKLNTVMHRRFMKNTNPEFGGFTYPLLGTNVSNLEHVREADVIYIHWVLNGFMSLKNFEQVLGLGKPVILFLHDMWSITGGCHYSLDCDKYMKGCNNCQIFKKKKNRDLSYKGFTKKLRLYNKYDNLFFVSPSKWLYDCAKKSALTKAKPISYIPNILDDKIFKPCDKREAKRILNYTEDDIVITFGAMSVTSPYKGWPYLQKALELLHSDNQLKNIKVLIFGSGYNKEIDDSIPFETKFVGYLDSEYSTTILYNASDVFVAPSVAETFGYVILEAMSCGTPVVAFNTGGIPDIIEHKKNGYLSEYKNANDLAEGVKYCLSNGVRGYRLPTLQKDKLVFQHIELMKKILEESNSR